MPASSAAEELLRRIRALEEEVLTQFEEKERRHGYVRQGRTARFSREALENHRQQQVSLWRYVSGARWGVALTAPLIYFCCGPFLLLDFALTLYQRVCFPVYGVPLVEREDYFLYDRAMLEYLNVLEKVNCYYCSYANGLCAYAAEIAARTEQHWCPIKHAEPLRAPHSRYGKFFDYGDAEQYAQRVEELRRDFEDLRQQAPPKAF